MALPLLKPAGYCLSVPFNNNKRIKYISTQHRLFLVFIEKKEQDLQRKPCKNRRNESFQTWLNMFYDENKAGVSTR